MPLSSISSISITEIHLLRGGKAGQPFGDFVRVSHSSEPFNQLLVSEYKNKYHKNDNNFSVSLTPLYIKGLVTGAGPTETFTGNGMSINLASGVITLDAAAPADEVRNFILAAIAEEKNGTETITLAHYFRVHIHHDIAHAWLTPSPMAVPRDATNFRCSTYAEFDDGEIADISGDFTVDFEYTTTPNVDEIGVLTVHAGDPDLVTIDLEVKLSYGNPKKTVIAAGKMMPYTPSNKLTLLAGPGDAVINGAPAFNSVPNMLIVPDGFANNVADNSLDKLEEGLRKMITDINKPLHAPIDLLLQENAINIWLAKTASIDSAVGYQSELYIKAGKALPLPTVTPMKKLLVPMTLNDVFEPDTPMNPDDIDPKKAWTIGRMLFIFGLPMLAHATMTRQQIKDYWIARLKLTATLINTVPNESIDAWKELSDRRLMNQRNTLLGTYSGRANRLPFNDEEDTRLYTLQDDDRYTRPNLNTFFSSLTFNGTAIGTNWNVDGDPAKQGKDYRLVCFLLNSYGGRAQNNGSYFFVNGRNDLLSPNVITIEPDPQQPGTRAFRPVAENTFFPNPQIPVDALNTFLHESAHSFTLGDEYGEKKMTYSGAAADINNSYSNLQARSDLELNSGSGTTLDFWKTKWRWHRMDKCRVLKAAITKSGNEYTLTLVPLQAEDAANRFKSGDEVILRFRELQKPIQGDVLLSPVMKVIGDENNDTLKLTVKNYNLYNPLPAGYPLATTVIETAFGKDCIVYVPKKAPENALSPIYQYAEVTGINVIHHMINKNKPLTPEPCVKDEDTEQKPDIEDILDLSDTFSPSSCCSCGSKIANRPRIVGLYAGGRSFFCGIYHPSGHCMMRGHNLAEFCSVCKYVLTEVLHPELHPKVDKYIQEFYPI